MNLGSQKLKDGDLRQKGKSEEVVADVFKKPQLFGDVIAGIPVYWTQNRASECGRRTPEKRSHAGIRNC